MKPGTSKVLLAAALIAMSGSALANDNDDHERRSCSIPTATVNAIQSQLARVATMNNGGLFSPGQLSTANLYGPTQPGGPLYGLNNSNPFNPDFLAQGTGLGRVPGGVITFGGGVALYASGKVIGGLGLSGDSACADHVIAYRMRRLANLGLDKVPGGVAPDGTGNIIYANGAPTGYQHPHCGSTDVTP
jgi:hypothetical protein